MFDKILIANRGEIALRIIRTCKKMGIETVTVFSDEDVRSLHVREADHAVHIGPSPAPESYLAKEKIIGAALACGCRAVHPGYGFLSENTRFADEVTKAGLVFIGPPASVISLLGDKTTAKRLATQAGMRVVPGHPDPLNGIEEARIAAKTIGYPVLLKPAAGGGGKGMHVVVKEADLEPTFTTSQNEARKAFGDDRIFLEKYISRPRHVEIQIMADHHGNVIYLGERECSIQRRYQKIIEEAPSPAVDRDLRTKMGRMACALAEKAGYRNAGTVEFILDPDGAFYFLEMNTRLQVEHPVTEMVVGLDLVELQLRIADGQPLPLGQEAVHINGWAIEARICAEDPERDFLPSTGIITRYAPPRGKDIRLDSGIEAGSTISVFYDSMMSKVVTHGETREAARHAMIQALNRYHIEGVYTNRDFVNAILNHPAFAEADLSTRFIEENFNKKQTERVFNSEDLHFMVMAATLVYHNRQTLVRDSLKPMTAKVGQAHEEKPFHDYVVKGEENVFQVRLSRDEISRHWSVNVHDHPYRVITPHFEFYRRRIKLNIDGQNQYFHLQYRGNFIWVAFCGITRTFEIYTPGEWHLVRHMPTATREEKNDTLFSPMPGLILDIKVKKGDWVYRGQDLVIIESMKMESGVSSPCDGEVKAVHVQAGQTVETGDVMITFES